MDITLITLNGCVTISISAVNMASLIMRETHSPPLSKNSKKKTGRASEKAGSPCRHFISNNTTWLGNCFYQ